jgi:hypothetical protein
VVGDHVGVAGIELAELGDALDLRALRFIEIAEADGVPAAVAERDDPFGDYSRGPRSGKPDPTNAYPAP